MEVCVQPRQIWRVETLSRIAGRTFTVGREG